MKYIRTKAGEIYDIDDLYICDNLNSKPYGVKDSSWLIYKESIIRQADTIEELCDEFIVISDNCKRPIISSLPFDELQLYAKGRTKYAICYGAIWTEWGLKYVAKLNDKGELELL